MKNIIVISRFCVAALCVSASLTSALAEPQKSELLQRVQGGDRAAMLEAGNTGDASFVPPLETYIQTNMSALSNDLAKIEEIDRQLGTTSGLSMERELALRYRDGRLQGAQMALAKLGVRKYLDEIVTELTATNTPSGRELSRAEIREAKLRALEKLAYIANPSRDKYVASPLASYAIAALRSMITNAPAAGDYTAWQQWWEQNKDKYP